MSESIDSLLDKADALFQEGKYSTAKGVYEIVTRIAPEHPDAWRGLGLSSLKEEKYEAAAIAFEKEVLCNPNEGVASTYCLLGLAKSNLALWSEARRCFDLALKWDPNMLEAMESLCNVYYHSKELNKAELLNLKLLEMFPDRIDLLFLMSLIYASKGDHDTAREYWARILRITPDDWRVKWLQVTYVPSVYSSSDQMHRIRDEWKTTMKLLYEEFIAAKNANIELLVESLSLIPTAHIYYQPGDFLEENILYGKLISALAARLKPELQKKIPPRKREENERLRVGIIFFHQLDHVISKTHRAWSRDLDSSRFETHVFYLGKLDEENLKVLETWGEKKHYLQGVCANLTEFPQYILDQKMDVLIYPEASIYAQIYLLAAMRLAPIQCASLGSPVTTGLETMDYYLSSELMETDMAQQMYTEKLVCLPNLAVKYKEASVPLCINRITENACQEKTRFINAQVLPKLLPEYDEVYSRIAERVPNAEFHFITIPETNFAKVVTKRLECVFAKRGLEAKDYLVIHDTLPFVDYLSLMKSSDICLDSNNWSGFNTSLDAAACLLPIVTLPLQTMRSRHCYGVLKRMELDELIAKNLDDYVDIAVHLALDLSYRKEIQEKIQQRKHLLFDDDEAMQGLERFLLGL
jgi:protein O-GlcNAc transferase